MSSGEKTVWAAQLLLTGLATHEDTINAMRQQFRHVFNGQYAQETPFIVSWKPGDRPEVSWYDDGSWHDVLAQSDGLKPQPRTYGTVEDAADDVKEAYDLALPHYQALHSHRLRPIAA